MRPKITVAFVLMSLLGALTAGAEARSARSGVVRDSPIVVVLDTGVRATHQEFDYRGPDSRSDQMVAWWDFTADKKGKLALPKPGQLWDPLVREPYDNWDHGTGVTAMAVGLNRDPSKTPSAAPGYRFGVAKVLAATSGNQAPLGDAIRWAFRTVRASVISISIGSVAPVPSAVNADVYDALDEARAAGVLVVVANGNGWANVGALPGEPAWAMWYSSSTSVLAVGGAGTTGLLITTDPEVTTNYAPRTAVHTGDRDYADTGGTSFAAPFVSGLAARLIAAARGAHRRADPARIEQLIEYSAVDTTMPPTFEGYGEVELAQLPPALAHARAGTLPGRPSPDPTKDHVDRIAVLRDLWSNELRHPATTDLR